jgi:hypothetical protein
MGLVADLLETIWTGSRDRGFKPPHYLVNGVLKRIADFATP